MKVDDMVKIWHEVMSEPARKPAFKTRERLDRLNVTDMQFRWLIKQFTERYAYHGWSQFFDYAENELREDCVPEDIICLGYMSGDPNAVALAEDLENLNAAWFPNEEVTEEAKKLRDAIQKIVLV